MGGTPVSKDQERYLGIEALTKLTHPDLATAYYNEQMIWFNVSSFYFFLLLLLLLLFYFLWGGMAQLEILGVIYSVGDMHSSL